MSHVALQAPPQSIAVSSPSIAAATSKYGEQQDVAQRWYGIMLACLTASLLAATLVAMVAIRLSPAGFPMAPSQDEWNALGPEERAMVVASLPGEVTDAEMAPPEGDRHFKAKVGPLGALRGYFRHQGKRIYLAAELPIYYPAEPRFAPDLLAVLEVDDHDRDKWVVSAEGRGLDWVLEVHVGGDRKKDDADAARARVLHLLKSGEQAYTRREMQLQELRKHRKVSQEALAKAMKVSQAHVSQTEQRDDVLLSTLRSWIAGLGGELHVIAKFPGETIELELGDENKAAR